jgi:dipeptidyl aminopeptidase/acylaminoacyl peptidase
VSASRAASVLAYSAATFRGHQVGEEDAALRKARTDAGVAAILHDSGRLRHWDHDLGAEQLRLLVAKVPAAAAAGQDADAALATARDLTPEPGRALDEQSFELTPDGGAVVTGWVVTAPDGDARTEIAIIDTATAQRRTLLAGPGLDFESPKVSPDGKLVVAVRLEHDTYDRPGDATLVLTSLDGGEPRDLLPGFDRYPGETAWSPDSRSVFFTADHEGRRPVFRVDLASGEVTRVTTDHGAYESLCPAPGGASLYALRSAFDAAPAPVRIDLANPAAGPHRLASPGASFEFPGRLEEVSAEAADGTAIRAWLVVPAEASAQSPAPLVLWVRGYSAWGGAPFTDVMAITDEAEKRADIDAGRTAMMGGSFGGYMANWIAGHTDRFLAIVSHAGIWALDQVFGTTDAPAFWRRTFGDFALRPERYVANSPHLHADKIVTPILIIHGDKDYRAPVGEALRMWSDLSSRSKTVRFLYFPDENHWILKPGDIEVWYQTVLAFLAEHLRGEAWQQPELLS